MKFCYEYRTSDNVKHSGVLNAVSRDAAFKILKTQGIRPSYLVEAPGLFNKLFGKGKRWLAIVFLCIVVIGVFVLAQRKGREAEDAKSEAESAREEVQNVTSVFDSQVRRHPIGDVAVIANGIRTGWSDVFELEGERFLASFAIPGVEAGLRSTSESEIRRALEVKKPVRDTQNLSLESRQILAMVEGMKSELREFLKDGGSISQYGNRLVARQEAELAAYRRAKNEMSRAIAEGCSREDVADLLEELNESLRKMGIRPLVLPE